MEDDPENKEADYVSLPMVGRAVLKGALLRQRAMLVFAFISFVAIGFLIWLVNDNNDAHAAASANQRQEINSLIVQVSCLQAVDFGSSKFDNVIDQLFVASYIHNKELEARLEGELAHLHFTTSSKQCYTKLSKS